MSPASTLVARAPVNLPVASAPNHKPDYLNDGYGLKSWLLTHDHKRIGILYLLSITVFFFIGGWAATMMRLQLMTPQGNLVTSEQYNRLFTLHGSRDGVVLLDPLDPDRAGQFPAAADDRRAGRRVPAPEPAELVHLRSGRDLHALRDDLRRGGHRVDVLHALQLDLRQRPRARDGLRHLRGRLFVDLHGAQLHRHPAHDARAGHALVPAAAVLLGASTRRASIMVLATPVLAVTMGLLGLERVFGSRRVRSRAWAATHSCSSTCSGSTRIRPCTS